jgi:hypothetical protein
LESCPRLHSDEEKEDPEALLPELLPPRLLERERERFLRLEDVFFFFFFSFDLFFFLLDR